MHENQWVCCQLGAREHYSIARALAGEGKLGGFVTDTWMPPEMGRWLPPLCPLAGLRERFHPALARTRVRRDNAAFVGFELVHRLRKTGDWPRIVARNRFFGRRAVRHLRRLPAGPPGTVFAYSYAALEIFRWAKGRGWRTVLGQIDPGPVEVEIVRRESAQNAALREPWTEPPPAYWEAWRQECALADRIVVNSDWSRDALQQAGVPTGGLRVVPLAYEMETAPPPRQYPTRFTPKRPLRVLFLGQINLRKGVARLIRAAGALRSEPVEFWMVGAARSKHLPAAAEGCRMRWLGPVSRAGAAEFYRQADVFLLPTLSDGFALTQLEAQAQALPVIASACCGRVVRDGVNGHLLPAPDAESIAAALRGCLAEPERLARWAASAAVAPEFSLVSLAKNLSVL